MFNNKEIKKLSEKIESIELNNYFVFDEGYAKAKKGDIYVSRYVKISIKDVLLALLKELKLDIEFKTESTRVEIKKTK